MARHRRGVALPIVLALLVALGLLSALAVTDALAEWRVATLAEDAVRARAAAEDALAVVGAPPDLALLCVSGPGAPQVRGHARADGSAAAIRWRALGSGTVLVEIQGRGRFGARWRLLGWLAPDTVERDGGLLRCPAASRLRPTTAWWLTGDPGG